MNAKCTGVVGLNLSEGMAGLLALVKPLINCIIVWINKTYIIYII